MSRAPAGASLRHRYPHDISRVLGLQIFGCHVFNSNVRYSRNSIFIAVSAALALLGWSALFIPGESPQRVLVGFFSWCVYFLATCFGIAWIMHVLTQGFLNLTVTLGRCLTARGKQAYESWADTYLSTKRQAIFASTVAVSAPAGVWLVSSVVGNSEIVLILPPSYVVVAATGFLVGCAAYWAAAGVVLCRRLSRPGRLTLYAVIPASTPGVEDLSQLMVTSFVASALASGVLLFPFMLWTYDIKGPELDPALAVALPIVRTFLVAICSLMTLGLGLLPQIWLSGAIKETRRATMLRLLRKLGQDRLTWQGQSDKNSHELFKLTADSPSSTVGSANIVQIGAAAAASIAPWLYSVIFR